ncbi:MAG: SIR2 family protein [Acidobacteriota bacterium]|nr:SIR2 family protein [Acidobacteriota bacterium]
MSGFSSMHLPEFVQGSDEQTAFQELLRCKDRLVPFVGAGFSIPLCPGWKPFLEDYYKDSASYLLKEDHRTYRKLNDAGNLEGMARLLFGATRGRQRDKLFAKYFDVKADKAMHRKQQLVHRAFPGWKITTNFDRLIESGASGSLYVIHGDRPEELDRAITLESPNALLKIHGGLDNMASIILTGEQYESAYGHAERYDGGKPLPKLLRRLYTNHSLLFIGCSLGEDRTMMILEDLADKRPHFALLKRQPESDELVLMRRRLSILGIQPIWFNQFEDIETVLSLLAGDARRKPKSKQLFVGRELELQTLIDGFQKPGSVQTVTGRLFQLDGAGGVGKTTLARQARDLCRDRFPDGCYEFDMTRTTPSAFAVQLARRLNLEIDEPRDKQEARQHISRILQDRRTLILLDNLTNRDAAQWLLPDDSPSCFIITTRNREIGKALVVDRPDIQLTPIHLEAFTQAETLQLFRKVLREDYHEDSEEDYLALAERLGFMPIALRLALNLMIFPPRWSAKHIRETELSRLDAGGDCRDLRTLEAVFNLADPYFKDERAKEVLRLLAQCAPGPVPLSFLQRLDGADPNHLEMLLEELCSWSWCDAVEGEEKAFELHVLVREVVQNREDDLELCERFLSLVQQVYTDETDQTHFIQKDRWLPQAEEAVRCLADRDDLRLKQWVNWTFGEYCSWRGHGQLFLNLSGIAMDCFPEDIATLAVGYNHQAGFLRNWGKLEEAMKVLKNLEVFFEELGDHSNLAAVYANQAGILFSWRKLEEAMVLYKKVQVLTEKLDFSEGLARSYGSQAVILREWGKLEEAMALHKKADVFFEELGNRAGLAQSYGNQAVILREWGKLEEAMALYKKVQALFMELGDRPNLAKCYCNQASILSDWGKLEEAMTLVKKDQELMEELGDRAGLAISFWNQGSILAKLGEAGRAIELLRQAIDLHKELGIPTDDWEKNLAAFEKEHGLGETTT